jgi:hypothetical protein
MKYATYVEGEANGYAPDELRAAMSNQRTWVSNGLLLVWTIEGDNVRFELVDANKPGFKPYEKYIMTLKNAEGVREYEITSAGLTLPLSDLAAIEIPKLYGDEAILEKLVCIAPVIRK